MHFINLKATIIHYRFFMPEIVFIHFNFEKVASEIMMHYIIPRPDATQ